jgi:hypothetical protein
MKQGTVVLIGLILSGLPFTASAEYFFAANDAAISKCLYTDVSGKYNLEKMLESSYGVNCDAIEDKEGTVIVTCKAALTNMVFAAKTEKTCESLRNSVKQMIGN